MGDKMDLEKIFVYAMRYQFLIDMNRGMRNKSHDKGSTI
jgi:hypothetical protein